MALIGAGAVRLDLSQLGASAGVGGGDVRCSFEAIHGPVEPERRPLRRSGACHTEPHAALQRASGTGRDECEGSEWAYRPRAILAPPIAAALLT
jgi:hypothetical protein